MHYLIHLQKVVYIGHIKNPMTHCTQLPQQRKSCCSKMLYVISSQSVTDGIHLSVSKSKLVYSSLIFVDNKLAGLLT